MGSALCKHEPLPPAPGGNLRQAREVRGFDLHIAAKKFDTVPEHLRAVEENEALFTKPMRERAMIVYGFPSHFFDREVKNDFRFYHVTGEAVEQCANCAYIADYLCDFPMGKGKTCDAPLCEDHANDHGEDLHFCPSHEVIAVKMAQEHSAQ